MPHLSCSHVRSQALRIGWSDNRDLNAQRGVQPIFATSSSSRNHSFPLTFPLDPPFIVAYRPRLTTFVYLKSLYIRALSHSTSPIVALLSGSIHDPGRRYQTTLVVQQQEKHRKVGLDFVFFFQTLLSSQLYWSEAYISLQ